jgi:hypothetical protein
MGRPVIRDKDFHSNFCIAIELPPNEEHAMHSLVLKSDAVPEVRHEHGEKRRPPVVPTAALRLDA